MKRKFGGVIVKKAIVTAMTIMLLGNSVLSVRAEEVVPIVTQQEVQQEESAGTNGSMQVQEEQAAESVQEESVEEYAEEQIQEEQSVQTESGVTAEEIEKAVNEAEEAASQAVETVEQVKEEYASIQSEAEEKKDDLVQEAEQVQTNADELEEEVKNSLIVKKNDDGTEQYEVIVGNKKSEDGTIESITMQQYVDVQTEIAQSVKEELEKALSEDAEDEKIAEYAEAVKEAAKGVYNAAWMAEQAYSKAEKNLKEEIKKYNVYAKAYGYELLEYNGEILEYTQEEQQQLLDQTGLNEDTEDIRKDLASITGTDLQEQKDVIEQAKTTVDDAKETYENVQQVAESLQQSVEAAENVLQDEDTDTVKAGSAAILVNATQQQIEQAQNDIEQAQQKYETAKSELDDILASVKGCVPNLSSLKLELTKKIAAMGNAKKDLNKVQERKKAAVSYSNWAGQLVKAGQGQITMGVYGQLKGDKQAGSNINDTNGKEFDIGDENVVTRDESNFAKVSKDDSIEVPYEIFKAYVAALYDRHNDNGDLILYVSSTQRDGLGISTSGTMKEIYWQYDPETRQIIPDSMFVKTSETDALPEWMTREGSIYFKGYTFKHENDGTYHIDGHLCKAKKPETPEEPSTTPEEPSTTPEEPGTTPETPGTTTPSESNGDNTVIDEPIVPLADEITVINDIEVPLEESISSDVVRIEEEEVPLSDSVPKTGDESRNALPFLIISLSAISVSLLSKFRRKDS